MRNIELKVKAENFTRLRYTLNHMGAIFHGILRQTDIYFNVRHGRLKLRSINKTSFELIYYSRPNRFDSKLSFYEKLAVDASQLKILKKILERSLGTEVVVQKKRELWIYKNTRIHLDTVQKLGAFVELETVIREIALISAKAEHKKVISLLNLDKFLKIKGSYSNLLKK